MEFLRRNIKHVIYIIKENRTYDQVLGDLGKGNSDPALAEFPQPSGLIHLMLETLSYDDVGRAYDRAQAAGCHISATLGRHTNDKMFSFYVRSPGGFDIEYGCDGMQLDWNSFVPTTSLKDSDWGHKWNFG